MPPFSNVAGTSRAGWRGSGPHRSGPRRTGSPRSVSPDNCCQEEHRQIYLGFGPSAWESVPVDPKRYLTGGATRTPEDCEAPLITGANGSLTARRPRTGLGSARRSTHRADHSITLIRARGICVSLDVDSCRGSGYSSDDSDGQVDVTEYCVSRSQASR